MRTKVVESKLKLSSWGVHEDKSGRVKAQTVLMGRS
jgi:hypothetical protein